MKSQNENLVSDDKQDIYEQADTGSITGDPRTDTDSPSIWSLLGKMSPKDFDIRRNKVPQINLNPVWQRPVVWKQKSKILFIISILEGLPVPGVVLVKSKNDDIVSDVLDGKQRLSTLLWFAKGSDSPDNKNAPDIRTLKEEYPRIDKWFENEAAKFTFENLREDVRTNFENFKINVSTVILNPEDRATIFGRVNTGANPLTYAELVNSLMAEDSLWNDCQNKIRQYAKSAGKGFDRGTIINTRLLFDIMQGAFDASLFALSAETVSNDRLLLDFRKQVDTYKKNENVRKRFIIFLSILGSPLGKEIFWAFIKNDKRNGVKGNPRTRVFLFFLSLSLVKSFETKWETILRSYNSEHLRAILKRIEEYRVRYEKVNNKKRIALYTSPKTCVEFASVKDETGALVTLFEPVGFCDSIKEAINVKQEGRCAMCKKEEIQEFHHTFSREAGGFGTFSNCEGLCGTCHNKKSLAEIKKKKIEE